MGKYIELVQTFLTEDNLNYGTCTNSNEHVYIRLPYDAEHCRFDIVCDTNEEQDVVMVFIYPTMLIKQHDAPRIAELVCRLNHRLNLGFFDFDYQGLGLRFKSTIDVEGGELTFKMFINMLHCAILTMDKSFPMFMAVLYGGQTPEAASNMQMTDDITTQENTSSAEDDELNALH